MEGALGAEENGKERLVRTPWTDDEIPFAKAAEIGTEKVIKEHSTIGVVVTTDGAYELWNRYAFTPTDRFTGRWELLENGVKVKSGELQLPLLKPGERGKLNWLPSKMAEGKECFFNFEFALKEGCKWAEKGFVVARDQVKCGTVGAWECGNEEMGKRGHKRNSHPQKDIRSLKAPQKHQDRLPLQDMQ